MNKSLQKDIITPTEKINKRRGYSKKYMTRHTTMCVTLANDADADIIEWLAKQDNKSDAVRTVLRDAILTQRRRMAFSIDTNPNSHLFCEWEE